MQTLEDISLSQLMSEDFSVWICKNRQFGYEIYVEDENGNIVVDEKHVHPCAADSFADFCKNYLYMYEHANRKEAA